MNTWSLFAPQGARGHKNLTHASNLGKVISNLYERKIGDLVCYSNKDKTNYTGNIESTCSYPDQHYPTDDHNNIYLVQNDLNDIEVNTRITDDTDGRYAYTKDLLALEAKRPKVPYPLSYPY